MSFRLVKGKTKNLFLPVTPSTVFAKGALVTFTSGKLVPAVAGTLAPNIAGVIVKAIAATDADYAVDRNVLVTVPLQPLTEWEFVTSGLVATDIGVDVDLTNSVTVNRAASAIGVVRPLRRLSATRGVGHVRFAGAY